MKNRGKKVKKDNKENYSSYKIYKNRISFGNGVYVVALPTGGGKSTGIQFLLTEDINKLIFCISNNKKNIKQMYEKYPIVLTETKKGKTKYGITQKSKEVWNYMHYGFFNIKRIGNLYISGYTNNPQSSLPNSPRARKVIGENADLLTNKFIDEQYNEYKITGNRNGVHPVAYKYLQMLENKIIEE